MNATQLKTTAAACEEMIVIGGCGDLMLSKLLPALLQLEGEGKLSPEFKISCSCRSQAQANNYRQLAEEELFSGEDSSIPASWNTLAARLHPFLFDSQLATSVSDLGFNPTSGRRLIYLAIPPSQIITVCQRLNQQSVLRADDLLVLEKPLGYSGKQAQEIHQAVSRWVRSENILIHHHYAWKPILQDFIRLRAANLFIENNWHHRAIESVTIEVLEADGVNGRSEYYGQTGALIDMVQGQMLQLLAVIAMDLPDSFNKQALDAEKLKVLSALQPPTQLNRARYLANATLGILSLEDELEAFDCGVESYIQLLTGLNLPRWEGVKFILRTGKRMGESKAQIRIQFKNPIDINLADSASALLIELSPRPSIRLQLGDSHYLLTSSQKENQGKRLSYPEMLHLATLGSATTSVPFSQVLASWQWIDAIRESFAGGEPSLTTYVAGTTPDSGL